MARDGAKTRKPQSGVTHVTAELGFELWAPEFRNTCFGELYEKDHLPGLLGNIAGLDVLDAGCGTGRNIGRYLAGRARVTGVDISPAMIAEARKQLPKNDPDVVLQVGDLNHLAFAGASFDVVVASACLNGIQDLAPVFSEFSRVLRTNGIFIYSGKHPDVDAAKMSPKIRIGKQDVVIKSYRHDFETLRALAGDNGFEEVRRIELEPRKAPHKRLTRGYFYVILKYVKRGA